MLIRDAAPGRLRCRGGEREGVRERGLREELGLPVLGRWRFAGGERDRERERLRASGAPSRASALLCWASGSSEAMMGGGSEGSEVVR